MSLTQRFQSAVNLKRLADHEPIDRFNAAAKSALLFKTFKAQGILPQGMTPAEFVLMSMQADGFSPND